MKKIDKEKMLKLYSGLLYPDEAEELKTEIEKSNDLKNFKVELEANLDELKEVYQSYPDQSYFNNLSNSIINKVEEVDNYKFKPSFVYAFVIAVVIFISSQLFNFNSTNFKNDYSDLFNTSDIEEYLSLYQSSELNDFSEFIDTEIEFDYTAYLLSSGISSESFQSSVENEILDLLDENTAEKIYNEILNKKIL